MAATTQARLLVWSCAFSVSEVAVQRGDVFCILFSGIESAWAHGVVVSHPLRMRKALGSIPSVSTLCFVAGMRCAKEVEGDACISRESNPGHIDGNDVFCH